MSLTAQSNFDLHALMNFKEIHRGHIYILQNPAFVPDVLKIGKTRGCVFARARRLSRDTGVPEDFVVAHRRDVWDIAQAEDTIFARLDCFRPRHQKEFFRLSLAAAIAAVDEVIAEINSREPETLPERHRKWRDLLHEMEEREEASRAWQQVLEEYPEQYAWMHAPHPPDDWV